MERPRLRQARLDRGWSQADLAEKIGTTERSIHNWELGFSTPYGRHIRALCEVFGCKPEDIDLGLPGSSKPPDERMSQTNKLAGLWTDDLLSVYRQGIIACQDLYFSGNPYQVEAIIPLYCSQTAQIAQHPSPLQQGAARIASLAQQLNCELLSDREDFSSAEQAGRQAFSYGELAGDVNLQIASLIHLANIGFHRAGSHRDNAVLYRKFSTQALQSYQRAIALFNEHATPLVKGRTYAGIAEVHAMRGDLQEAMRTMGLAYEHYPAIPENDPAYPYLRASRYSLYVFGDAQSRLFLNQPKDADKALIAMQKETNDPEIEPVTNLDLLYYQAEVAIQQGNLDASRDILIKAAMLAKKLGSRLYFNKLAGSYGTLKEQWAQERTMTTLEELFQAW